MTDIDEALRDRVRQIRGWLNAAISCGSKNEPVAWSRIGKAQLLIGEIERDWAATAPAPPAPDLVQAARALRDCWRDPIDSGDEVKVAHLISALIDCLDAAPPAPEPEGDLDGPPVSQEVWDELRDTYGVDVSAPDPEGEPERGTLARQWYDLWLRTLADVRHLEGQVLHGKKLREQAQAEAARHLSEADDLRAQLATRDEIQAMGGDLDGYRKRKNADVAKAEARAEAAEAERDEAKEKVARAMALLDRRDEESLTRIEELKAALAETRKLCGEAAGDIYRGIYGSDIRDIGLLNVLFGIAARLRAAEDKRDV